MKKQVLFFALMSIVLLPAFAQDNKMVKGDIGLRYGLTFSGNVGQQLILSGMISDRSEIGSIVSVGITASKSSQTDSTYVYTDAGIQEGTETETYKVGQTNILINPFYAYHFPIQSNVDLYVGANAGVGVGIPRADREITETVALNYESKSTASSKMPATLFINGGIMVGCQYFFYKRLSIGAVASLGVAYGMMKGKVKEKVEVINTGTDNSDPDYLMESASTRVNSSTFSLATSSYVGINLAFYFGKGGK